MQQLQHAAELLSIGKLVAFPTETVYGVGADATNEAAIKQIFLAKGRPNDRPLTVHISSIEKISVWAREVPAYALLLAKHFWPGPLTLVLPKQKTVSDIITGGLDTVGIRIPKHPLTLALLKQFSGIVGPSANQYTHKSPTTAQQVQENLGDKIDCILDGGPCTIGIESTVVSCISDQYKILRHGAISNEEIEKTLALSP